MLPTPLHGTQILFEIHTNVINVSLATNKYAIKHSLIRQQLDNCTTELSFNKRENWRQAGEFIATQLI